MAYYINIDEWKPEQVFEWIRGLSANIASYGKHFVEHGINGSQLLNFGPDDLQMIGIEKVGHKLEVMSAITNLRESHLSLDYETLQSLALRVSAKSRSLSAEIRLEEAEERIPSGRGKVTTSTLSGVTDLLRSVKDLLFWLDRSPFEGQEPYTSLRNTLVKISIEMATSAQRDQFAENPVAVIRSDCNQITTLCEKVVVELSDPYIAQPATLDVATVKARQDEEMKLTGELSDCWFLGMHIVTNHRGIHLVDGIRFQSASHQTGKIEVGDEIVQVNYQTVLSWDHTNLQTALVENPAKVILTTKKRPKHSNTFGQIYIKPYRLPSKKRDSSFRWSEHISSPSYLVIPTVHIASSSLQSPEISQSEIPSEASGGESECDDDTFALPSSDTKNDESGVVAPTAQLYIPKPRVGITRRATVAGVAPSLSLQANKQVTPWSRNSNTNNLLSQTRPHSFARCAMSSNVPLLTRTESLNAISELKEFEKINTNFEENNNCEKGVSNVTQETTHNLVTTENKIDTLLHPLENQFSTKHHNMKPKVPSTISSEIEEKNITNLKYDKSMPNVPEHSVHSIRSSAGLEIMVTPPISNPYETSTPPIPCRASVDGVTPPPRPPLSRTSSKSLVGDLLINTVVEEDPPALPPRTPHAKAPPTPLEAKPQPMTPNTEAKSGISTGFYSSTDGKQQILPICNLEFPAVMALPPFLTQRVEPPPRTVSPLLGLRLQPPKPEEIHVALERLKPKTTESARSVPCRSLQEIDCQGWLYRRRISRRFLGGARWTKRWYVLRKNTVYGYKDQEDQKAESLMCLNGFNVTATIDKSKKFVFKIHHSASSFFFACENQEDLDRWLASLQSACSQISAGSSPIPKRDCYYSETDDDSITEGEREAKSPSPRKKILGITLSPSISRKSRTPPGLPTSTSASGMSFFASKANPEKVTSASLDRKYLRFLSHEEMPIPTPQYRSYRKLSADTKRELPKLNQKPIVPLKPTRMAKSESPPVRPPTIAERRMGSEPRGRVFTEPLRLNIKRSPDRSPQRSNVSSRRSSFDQSRGSSVDSRTSPLSTTHDEYIGGSPEKNWMNSLRKNKPPVPPKCQSPDGSKLKSAATYQSVKLPLTPDMHLAFEMTLGSKKSDKNKFLGLVSPKFGRKVSSVPDTPGKIQRSFFNDSNELKKKNESDNHKKLSVMSSAENRSDRRRVARHDSFLSWNKRKIGNSLPMDDTYSLKEAALDESMLSPRLCKPTMGISMIGKQRRTPTLTTADVFVYSPPSTPGLTALHSGAIENTSRTSTVPSTPVPSANQAGSDGNATLEKCQRSSLEYPPVFEPCTYSLQRKIPPRPAPRTKFFNSEYYDSKSSDA